MTKEFEIGRGIHGVVYKVSFTKKLRRVEFGERNLYAAKVFFDKAAGPDPLNELPTDHSPDAAPYNAFERFKNEWANCQVTHPAVLRPVACVANPERPILVYPFWNGGHLENWMLMMEQQMSARRFEDFKFIAPEDAHRLKIFKVNRLEIAAALLEAVQIIHDKHWLHNDLHAKNILLHFPAWDWTLDGHAKRTGERSFTGASSLVFVTIMDFGISYPSKRAKSTSAPKYHEFNWLARSSAPWPHVAPELTNAGNNAYNITEAQPYSVYTDVWAIGSSITRMCKTFFTNMDDVEWNEWTQKHPTATVRSSIDTARNTMQLFVHRLSNREHKPPSGRLTARENARLWNKWFGVSSIDCLRPIQSWWQKLDQ